MQLVFEQCRHRSADPVCSKKSTCNFWLPENLMNNSLLLTGSLIDYINCWLTHFIATYYILYSYSKVRWRKENVFFSLSQISRNIPIYLLKTNPCIGGLTLFKPELFKGQLCMIFLLVKWLLHLNFRNNNSFKNHYFSKYFTYWAGLKKIYFYFFSLNLSDGLLLFLHRSNIGPPLWISVDD